MSNKSLIGAQHHITPIKTYAYNVTALLILMYSTTFAYEHPLGDTLTNNIVAMAIAVTKGLLIIFIFMGLRWASTLCRVFCVCSFFFLSLMYGILLDYGTRGADAVVGFHGDGGSALREGAGIHMKNTPGDHSLDVTPGKMGSP